MIKINGYIFQKITGIKLNINGMKKYFFPVNYFIRFGFVMNLFNNFPFSNLPFGLQKALNSFKTFTENFIIVVNSGIHET